MADPVLSSFETAVQKKPNRVKRFALFLIVIGLILIGLFVLFHFKFAKTANAPVKPTPTEFQFPSETPTASTTATITGTVTPGTKGSVTPSSKLSPTPFGVSKTGTLPDRSALSVNVENGSGVAGAGSKAAGILRNLGYNVLATGNADNFNYTNVIIQVKSAKSDFLTLLKNDLSQSYTIGSATSDLPATSTADAVVIVGK